MYVRDRMSKNPFCVSKDTTINKVLDYMAQNDFHRIPVVENGRIVGLITEGTITANTPTKATSLTIYELNYLLSKTKVDEIMIKDVIVIGPDVLLEEAAVKMRASSIGCLPVVENNQLIGIITQNDIFDAFVDLLGYYQKGLRVELIVNEDKPGILSEISQAFFNERANVTNLAVYKKEGHVIVVIRANNISEETLRKVMVSENYRIGNIIETK